MPEHAKKTHVTNGTLYTINVLSGNLNVSYQTYCAYVTVNCYIANHLSVRLKMIDSFL